MPQSRYFPADAVLTALFALRDRDCRMLFSAFDQIAENPKAMADAMGQDWDGRLVCLTCCGRFEIGYFIASTEALTFSLPRPRRN